MCGIVGYVGKQSAAPLLLAGLRRLEYRGYDSAGIATLEADRLEIRKRQGKIDEGLHPLLAQAPLTGSLGIGHTRWATHGPPSDANAHPHTDASGRIAVVHNGVIENHDRLRQRLLDAGHRFLSATDTEVLAHLIGVHYAQLETARDPARSRLAQAVERALREVIGTYGLAVIGADEPGLIVGARRGSPLILGLGQGENLLASDATAVVAHTRRVVYLNDYDLATVTADNFQVTSLGTQTARVQVSEIEFGAEAAERGAFPHYMLKEIFEQPVTIENALRGRLDLEEATARFGGLNLSAADLRAVDRVVIVACGTSWHAGLVGEHLIEAFAQVPVEVEYASEFRYRNPPLDKHTLVLVITQSGETADTLFALFLGRLRTLPHSRGLAVLRALEQVPDQVRQLLAQNDAIRELAARYADRRDFYFLGRQINFPVALEGALKLKEISYIHAEGYPAAEMKHGPIALMTAESPCVILAPQGFLYEKTLSNLEEVRARQTPVIALATEGDTAIAAKATEVLYVPRTDEFTFPLLGIIPLQLLAYHIAVLRGCDVDKPRNLAKSVTVE
jgi:glucosamine--fructose-6-phosphate aminotransferase (isomerizing)